MQHTEEVAKEVNVTGQIFNVLKSFFGKQAIVELTITVGYYGVLARFLVPLQIEVDESSAGSASDLIGRRDKSE